MTIDNYDMNSRAEDDSHYSCNIVVSRRIQILTRIWYMLTAGSPCLCTLLELEYDVLTIRVVPEEVNIVDDQHQRFSLLVRIT